MVFGVVCLWLGGPLHAYASLPPLLLETREQSTPLYYFEVFEDPTKQLTLEDILSSAYQSQFHKQQISRFQVHYDKAAWIRIKLQSKFPDITQWTLMIGMSMLEKVDLYMANPVFPDEPWVHYKSGALRPLSERPIANQLTRFPLVLLPDQEHIMYVRIENQRPNHIWFTVGVPEQYPYTNSIILLVYGIYFGMMLIFMLYNLTLVIALKDTTYLYYSAYIGVLLTLIIHSNGFTFFHLWPDRPSWNVPVADFLTALTHFTAVLFSLRFLHTKEYLPRFHKLLLCLLALPPLVFMGIQYDPRWSYVSGSLVVLFYPIIMAAGWWCWRHGHRAAKYFMMAWSFWIIGILWVVLAQMGIVPYHSATAAMVIVGTTIEIVLFSFALADRINISRKQKEMYQAQLIENQRQALAQQKRMTDSFVRFVPKEFLSLLRKEKFIDVQLGDAVQQHMTVLFLDIRAFTTMSESMSPQENFEFLNAYFRQVGPVIRQHHGFIDKYIGDAVMALFPGEPDDALRAAVALQQDLQRYNQQLRPQEKPLIRIGIGINTGPLMLGVIGEEQRIQSTVISDTVNLASRIESITKEYGGSILISEHTFYELQHPEEFGLRLIDKVHMKGKHIPVTIFEVFDGDIPESRSLKQQTLKPFETGIALYFMQQIKPALAEFQQCHATNPDDLTVRVYLERCRRMLETREPN